jgi:uncharacterized membrane protein YfcA
LTGLGAGTVLALAVFGLAAGVGITAVGPGGVLATIGLVVLTGLSPAEVAGTALVTHVATGVLGTLAYRRSGQLRHRATRRTAAILAGAAVVGTPLGVLANSAVSGTAFAIALGVAAAAIGVLVLVRDPRGVSAGEGEGLHPDLAPAAIAAVGFGVAVAAGLFGLGGPMLAVPLLAAAGLPMLRALAAAQAQSVVIASVGTVGYLTRGAIDWPLALVVGLPELAGVLLGWRIAHAVAPRVLKYSLAAVLIGLAPYLALHG